MASFDHVRRIALSLPETTEAVSWGNAHWRVKNKGFVWERPLHQSDHTALKALGEQAPDGAILGVRVADLGVRAAMIADDPTLFFTIPHFDGFPAILVRLEQIGVPELEELIVEAWLDRAPKRLAQQYLDGLA
ncbi:MAG TPA: MmcQ/YjbR family DNA-binding protein [Acidothermaceae bacterium]|nr:MmcQ/YjbR family DNA-binding protein [Acidothermaceae bacterium]